MATPPPPSSVPSSMHGSLSEWSCVMLENSDGRVEPIRVTNLRPCDHIQVQTINHGSSFVSVRKVIVYPRHDVRVLGRSGIAADAMLTTITGEVMRVEDYAELKAKRDVYTHPLETYELVLAEPQAVLVVSDDRDGVKLEGAVMQSRTF